MTPDKLKTIIAQKEGTEIEFKESKDSLARKVYESICAFLNRRGGHVVLGAKDNGEIVGVNPTKVQEQMDQLAKDMNNPQLFKPTYYLTYEPMDIDGKKIIAEVGATSMKEMGKVMGTASKQLAGKADGRVISEIVKKLLA